MTVFLTEHFRVSEFDQRARHGLEAVPYPLEWVLSRLMPLARVLEVLRTDFGAPVTILSGYRSPAYNAKIGGAKASQHMQGRAADIVIQGVSADRVHGRALALHRTGAITLGGLGAYPGFTHLDIRPGRLARWTGARTAGAMS